eukprot:SAG31_NODE_2430_length_5708_cov_2.891246_3_plen_71_part_00
MRDFNREMYGTDRESACINRVWPIRMSPMVQKLLIGVLEDVGGDHNEFANKVQGEELVSVLGRYMNNLIS